MNVNMGEGDQGDDSITRLYTFEELHKMCFPKEHRRQELQRLAMDAQRMGYRKAARLLAGAAMRYYS